jgi:hypothetical protein
MTDITRGSGNVFKDLGLENPDEIKQAADTITLTRAELYAMRREIDTQPYEPREHYQMIADQGYNAAIDAILEKIEPND